MVECCLPNYMLDTLSSHANIQTLCMKCLVVLEWNAWRCWKSISLLIEIPSSMLLIQNLHVADGGNDQLHDLVVFHSLPLLLYMEVLLESCSHVKFWMWRTLPYWILKRRRLCPTWVKIETNAKRQGIRAACASNSIIPSWFLFSSLHFNFQFKASNTSIVLLHSSLLLSAITIFDLHSFGHWSDRCCFFGKEPVRLVAFILHRNSLGRRQSSGNRGLTRRDACNNNINFCTTSNFNYPTQHVLSSPFWQLFSLLSSYHDWGSVRVGKKGPWARKDCSRDCQQTNLAQW